MTDEELAEIVRETQDTLDLHDPEEVSGIDLRNILDFVDTVAGRKPLHLLRGHFHPIWYDWLHSNADAWGLYWTDAMSWETADPTRDWELAMIEQLESSSGKIPCFSASEALIEEVDRLGDYVPAAQEAQLLGYPLCCVQAYHERHHTYGHQILQAYRAASAGDCLVGLIENDVAVPIDQRAAEVFKNGFLSPICSFAYCDRCAIDNDAPGPRINQERANRFQSIAPDLVELLGRVNERHIRERDTWEAAGRNYFIDGLVWSRDVKPFFRRPSSTP